MGAVRVAILNNRSLLAAGVQSLLQSLDGLELSMVAADDPEAAAKLGRLAPNVIVLDSGDASLGEGIVTQMLEEHPRARVVALNLGYTGIKVYRMRRVRQTDLHGLLEVIRGRRRFAGKGSHQKATSSADGGNGGEAMGP